jgi:hypothetical protein
MRSYCTLNGLGSAVGIDSTTADEARSLELFSKIKAFLAEHSAGASGSAIAKAIRTRKDDVLAALDSLMRSGEVDCFGGGVRGKKRDGFYPKPRANRKWFRLVPEPPRANWFRVVPLLHRGEPLLFASRRETPIAPREPLLPLKTPMRARHSFPGSARREGTQPPKSPLFSPSLSPPSQRDENVSRGYRELRSVPSSPMEGFTEATRNIPKRLSRPTHPDQTEREEQ